MSAVLQYEWTYLWPGQTVGLYLHGFEWNDFGVFDARPSQYPNLPVSPGQDIVLTQGETSVHVDGTFARTVSIYSKTPFVPSGAQLYFIFS